MQSGAATFENPLAVPQNVKHRVRHGNSTPRNLPKRNGNTQRHGCS